MRLFVVFAALLALLWGHAADATAAGRFRLATATTPTPGDNINFGIDTWAGYGRMCLGLTPGAVKGGPDAALPDFGQDAQGCIVPFPAQSYGSVQAYAKTAGQTYQYTFDGIPVNVTLAADRLDVTSLPTDAAADFQLKNVLIRTYGTQGAVTLEKSIYIRDGSIVRFESVTSPAWGITTPAGGYGGAGTTTAPGSGYTAGTHFDVPMTGGSGTGAVAVVTIVGGAVDQIHINSWGNGAYVNGDVLGLTVPSGTLLAGSGLQYTLTHANGRITIRSETPNTTWVDEYGNPKRGGGAIIEGIEFTSTSHYLIPIDFRYINFEWQYATEKPFDFFFRYRDNTAPQPYGISFYNNFCGSPLGDASPREDCFDARQGVAQENYIDTAGRAIQIGTDVPNHSLPSLATRNVGRRLYTDMVDTLGPFNTSTYNHSFDWNALPPAHADQGQHFGLQNGVSYATTVTFRYNTSSKNEGALNTVSPQGTIMQAGDTDIGLTMGGVKGNNNIGWTVANQAAAITRATDPEVLANTVLQILPGAPNTNGSWVISSPRIRLLSGTGGLVSHNIIADPLIEVGTQPGVVVTDNLSPTASAAAYLALFPNLDYTTATHGNRLEFLRQFTPQNRLITASPPGVVNLDGTVVGALFPACPGETIGAWNDLTVWNCANGAWLAAHPPAN